MGVEYSGRVSFVWGDGEHTFRLSLNQLRELHDKTNVGPQELYMRMASKCWRVEDLRQVIRLGLIGGGMKAEEAFKLIQVHVDDRPLLHSVVPAMVILGATLTGEGVDSPKNAAPVADSNAVVR